MTHSEYITKNLISLLWWCGQRCRTVISTVDLSSYTPQEFFLCARCTTVRDVIYSFTKVLSNPADSIKIQNPQTAKGEELNLA